MKLVVYSPDGTTRREAEVEGLPQFEGNKGVQALKEVVVAQAANARQGTRSTKTRGEVRGGGKKPWRQKGTGRARHGSIRSPIWTGGGVVFGPRPADFSKKINHKVKSLALRRAFFERAVAGDIAVVETFSVASGKTKDAASIVERISPAGTVLLVDAEFNEAAQRAARNLPRVTLREAASVNPTDLCRYDKYIMTEAALQQLLPRLKSPAPARAEVNA